MGASVVAMFLPLQPIAGAVLSYTFLGTSVRRGTLVGGFVIALGLIAVTVGGCDDITCRVMHHIVRLRLSEVSPNASDSTQRNKTSWA